MIGWSRTPARQGLLPVVDQLPVRVGGREDKLTHTHTQNLFILLIDVTVGAWHYRENILPGVCTPG